MSTLKDQLKADLTTAMKARDELTLATLRMTLTAIGNEEVAGKEARQLSDDEVLKVIAREAKKRREAAEAFTTGGATDRAQREVDEGTVLDRYLPAQLSDAELTAMVAEAVAETGASGPQAMGQVMKAVGPKVAGRAEGGRVAAAVKAALA
ncbi:MAG: GatB/YqeY domain-containing protein [Mycobacteriales bacterium]|nr:GatB/YqeY domain-containing protein [Mycobacteriales bacterium]